MVQILLTASSAHKQIIRNSFYALLLLLMAAGIFSSQYMTLFEFGRDVNLMREIALSTIFLWILLCSILSSNIVISEEIDNKITYTILTKPISSHGFIIGKLLGVASAVFFGVVLLTCIMFYSLWLKSGSDLALKYEYSTTQTFWEHMYANFFGKEILFFAQTLFLSTCSTLLLSSISIFCFTLMSQNIAFISTIVIVLISQLIHVLIPTGGLLPSLIIFQLPTSISQGQIVSFGFIALSTLYLTSYIIFIVTLNSILFSRRSL
ncbi:MAG: hypothetical protein HY606_01205 [Planctomycetes bacterium]|nr:hypothetical protein [Planctomycetota bacterium]